MEQMSFSGEQFNISEEMIIKDHVLVTDFFGDKRHWYAKLKQGGKTYRGISLDTQNTYDDDLQDKNLTDTDFAPLEPERITPDRAKGIYRFFIEYPSAREELIEYLRIHKPKN